MTKDRKGNVGIDIGASLGLEYVVFPDSTTNDVYSRDNYFYRF